MDKIIYAGLLVLLCTAATCEDDYLDQPEAPPNTYDFAVAQRNDWYAHGNPSISNGCQLALLKLYVSYLPQAQAQATCGVDARLYGCLIGNTIVVDQAIQGTRRVRYVMAHEMRHWLAGCSMGTVDGAHAIDAVWYPYEGVSIRE